MLFNFNVFFSFDAHRDTHMSFALAVYSLKSNIRRILIMFVFVKIFRKKILFSLVIHCHLLYFISIYFSIYFFGVLLFYLTNEIVKLFIYQSPCNSLTPKYLRNNQNLWSNRTFCTYMQVEWLCHQKNEIWTLLFFSTVIIKWCINDIPHTKVQCAVLKGMCT